MLRKLMILIFAGVVFFGIFTSNIVAATFEKLTPKKVPVDQIVPSSPLLPTNDKGFCLIQSDNDDVAYYFADFQAGDGFALYMDPAECGVPDPYPFQITDVHFYLYDPGDYTWPVEIQVNIRDLAGGDKCNGPGNLLCSQIYTIPSDSAYPNLVHLDLDTLCCIYAPFFLEIIYTGETDPPYPSLIMTDENTNPTDTCDAWAWYFFDTQHYYFEWSDFWTPPPPGYPVMRITGYTQQCHPESCWYWKDDTENSPSGTPDFDQNQDDWTAYCGPTAAANCLWWLDAVPEGMTPPELIELMAAYFRTSPLWGTYVDTMQIGLEQYFQDYGFSLEESTFAMPDFFEMEDSLKACQNIILLLGFWWSPDGIMWYREGGHFVTMAGVCSESLKIAISDPDMDGAVGGAPGRVRPPEHPPPGGYDPTLHNNPTFISHDMYNSDLNPENPSPGNPHWEINHPYGLGKFSGINVPEKFRTVTKPAPKDAAFYATEVEYAVMILGHVEVECNTIILQPGWQWISTNIDPDPCEMESLFVNCWDDLDIVIACDGSFCIPGIGCWIDCWNVCQMYNLHMSDVCTIQVCGSKVPTDKPCPLPAGWNCIAYFPECPLEPETALVSIWDNLDIVKNDGGEFCIPGVGCWIECMEYNEGYKIHLSSADTLIYPTSCPPCPPPYAKTNSFPGFGKTSHFNFAGNTGESYSIVVNSLELSGKHPQVGDEIGVFTSSGLCVGAGVWQGGILGIAAWQDNDRTEAKDGFTVDEKMIFKLWDKSENSEIELSASFEKGDDRFGVGAYALVNLKGISTQPPKEFKLAQNYPNPFNPETKISYALPKDCDVKLTIYNIMGQKIKVLVDEHQTAGHKHIHWDGRDDRGKDIASGIYFYRLDAGEFTESKKMVIIR